MSQPLVILIYGRDSSLIQTRRWVLEHARYEVFTTMKLAEIQEILSSRKVDLLILCHSLSRIESETALAMSHRFRPEGKYVIMTAEPGLWTGFDPDTLLSAFVDPQTLIATATRVLDSND